MIISQIKSTFKHSITQLVSRNFSLSIAWRSYLIDRLLNERLFIVYSAPKVGSTTLTISLKNNFQNQFVFHIHRLTKEAIIRANRDYQNKFSSYSPSTVPDNVIQSQFLLQNLPQLSKTKKTYFFSLVRDPVAALVSQYCENYFYRREKSEHSEEEIAEIVVEKILKQLNSDTLQQRLSWFEQELNQALATDIYAEKFEPLKGYNIYRDGSLLILKLETLDARITQAMHEFLGVSNFILTKGNQAEVSGYSTIYKLVKQSVKLPTNTLNQIYESKYVQYFYHDVEIQEIKQRWQS